MKSTRPINMKKLSSSKRWESHCTEVLSRLAGIRVIEHGQRQACNTALEAELADLITADRIGSLLATAFKNQPFKRETDKPCRTRGSTPQRLFRSHHIAHIIQQHAECLISKPSILLALGAELEAVILIDLTPSKIRQIICKALDEYVPPPPRKGQRKNVAAPLLSVEKNTPEALAPPLAKIGGLPV